LSWSVFDISGQERNIVQLEKQSSQPDFWSDQNHARSIMRRLSGQKRLVEQWRGIENKCVEISELITLAEAEEDTSLQDEIKSEIDTLGTQLDQLDLELAFSGEYDSRNALLSIHAGAGGTESMDWADMLMRMYLRWAERHGYKTDVLDITRGEEVGIKV